MCKKLYFYTEEYGTLKVIQRTIFKIHYTKYTYIYTRYSYCNTTNQSVVNFNNSRE